VAGVTGVVVDLAKGTATVEGTASYETLSARIEEAGYALINPA
jgi:copper chaperone CopZ